MKFNKALILFTILTVLIIGCSESQQQSQKSQQANQTVQLDSETEESLFEKAARAEAANRFEDAINYYERIIKEFPDSPRRDKALFMAGYIKYEYQKTNEQALTYFNKVIEEYPNSDLIDDAEFMIKAINSGKDALTTFEESNSGN